MRKIGILSLFMLCLFIVGITFLNSDDEIDWICNNDEVTYTFDTLLSYFDLHGYIIKIDLQSEIEPLIEPTSVYQIDTDTEDCGVIILYEDSITDTELIEIVVYKSFTPFMPDTPQISCGDYSNYSEIEADFQSNCVSIFIVENQELVFRISTQYPIHDTTEISSSIEILKSN